MLDPHAQALVTEVGRAARPRSGNVDQGHRGLPDVQGLDYFHGPGVDDIDAIGILQGHVDAGVVGAGPDTGWPVAVVVDALDQGRRATVGRAPTTPPSRSEEHTSH